MALKLDTEIVYNPKVPSSVTLTEGEFDDTAGNVTVRGVKYDFEDRNLTIKESEINEYYSIG